MRLCYGHQFYLFHVSFWEIMLFFSINLIWGMALNTTIPISLCQHCQGEEAREQILLLELLNVYHISTKFSFSSVFGCPILKCILGVVVDFSPLDFMPTALCLWLFNGITGYFKTLHLLYWWFSSIMQKISISNIMSYTVYTYNIISNLRISLFWKLPVLNKIAFVGKLLPHTLLAFLFLLSYLCSSLSPVFFLFYILIQIQKALLLKILHTNLLITVEGQTRSKCWCQVLIN